MDEEDVALAAFERFHRAALAGRFPQLHDRGDLWRILFTLTLRAAELLLEAHARCQEAEGAARAVGFARRGEPWVPCEVQAAVLAVLEDKRRGRERKTG